MQELGNICEHWATMSDILLDRRELNKVYFGPTQCQRSGRYKHDKDTAMRNTVAKCWWYPTWTSTIHHSGRLGTEMTASWSARHIERLDLGFPERRRLCMCGWASCMLQNSVWSSQDAYTITFDTRSELHRPRSTVAVKILPHGVLGQLAQAWQHLSKSSKRSF